MKKVESLNAAAFLIDGIPYQKGSVRIQVNGDLIGVAEIISDHKSYIAMIRYTEYIDNNDNGFSSVGDLILYLGNTILI